MSGQNSLAPALRDRVLHADDPRTLFDMGECSVCLHFLDPSDVALRVLCLVRLGRFAEAVRADNLEAAHELTGLERFHAFTALGTAFHRASMFVPADTYFSNAYALADTLNLDVRERATLYHYDALRYWSRGEYAAAEVRLDALAQSPEHRDRECEVRAWVAAGRGNLEEQLHLFAQSLAAPANDLWCRATVLRSYADLVSELYAKEHLDRVALAIEQFDWSADMAHHRFVAFRALAICAFLGGRTFKMIEYLCAAEASAVTPAQQCELLATKAWFAAKEGDRVSAREFRIRAMAFIDRVVWADEDDYRVALLILAREHLLAGEAISAERAWSTYRAIKTNVSPIFAHGLQDQRLVAMESAVEGLMLRHNGDRDGARKALTHAFVTFRGLQYTWRAIRAASDLYELGGKPELLDYAAIEAERRFPHARVFNDAVATHRRRLNALTALKLSSTQRAVITGILAGKTEREIAVAINISENTVRNRIARLYDKFTPGNRRRVALVERLRALGVE